MHSREVSDSITGAEGANEILIYFSLIRGETKQNWPPAMREKLKK